MLDASKNKGVPRQYLRNINVRWGSFDLSDLLEMRIQDCEIERYSICKGDLVVCEGGEPGRCAIWREDEPVFFQKALHRVRPFVASSEFLYYLFRAIMATAQMEKYYTGTTIKHLTGQALKSLPVPLPPSNEQIRIIEKLHKLSAFLDYMEETQASFGVALNGLKAKILELAIRGKLVPQDSADEPASVLLERIRADKEAQIKAGKIKRDKKESFIFRGEDNSYYLKRDDSCESLNAWDFGDLPNSWCICLLGEVCDYGNCINVDSESIADGDWVLDLEDIEKDTGKVITRVTKRERDAASTKHKFTKGQVLYSKLRPYLNKVVLADGNGYCTSEIIPLEFAAEVHPAYARYYLMSPTFLAYANRCSYGVKMPRLSTEDGRTAAFIIPPYREQVRIAERITSIFEKIDLIQNEI